MLITPQFANERKALQALCQDNLEELKYIYLAMHTNTTASQEVESIFYQLNTKLSNGDDCFAQFERAKIENPSDPKLLIASLVISTAYTFQAIYAVDRGDFVMAWFAYAEARFWCGSYSTNPGLQTLRQQTIRESTKKNASEGGRMRYERLYKPWREAVYRFAEELCPSGGWKSWSAAVNKISEQLDSQAPGEGERGVTAPTEKTIESWLKEMPDFEKFFPKKAKRKSS